MYTKFVIVCDDDVNARDWNSVVHAMTTRMEPSRDTVMIDNTPIDSLDFASPVVGLGSKMGGWTQPLNGRPKPRIRRYHPPVRQRNRLIVTRLPVPSCNSFRRWLIATCRRKRMLAGMAIVSINKTAAGHAQRVMNGIWSVLDQHVNTKFIIVCDDDVNARDWNDVIWLSPPGWIQAGIPC